MIHELIKLFLIYFFINVLFSFKHFVADYPLQNDYMLKKFLPGWGFFTPLLCHSLVHGVMTWFITMVLVSNIKFSIVLGTFDMVIHFFMDRIKASPRYLGRFKPLTAETYNLFKYQSKDTVEVKRVEARKKLRSNKLFWCSLGFDQFIHNVTNHVIEFSIMLYYIINEPAYAALLQYI